MTDVDALARRLTAARTRLIVDRPFLGALVLRLPLVAAGNWCKTTATDARALYYNPAWVDALSSSQLQFALAHEALHCALGHFARRGHRHKARWDLACDLAINPLLVAEGLTPPADALVLTPYAGMSAEEIYPCLDDNPDNHTLDDHAWDGDDGGGAGDRPSPADGGGAGDPTDSPPNYSRGDTAQSGHRRPPPLSAGDIDTLQREWQRHLAGAAQRAREAGKLSGACARLTDGALALRLPWRALLAGHLASISRDDYAWHRPSRRNPGAEGDALLPGLFAPSADLAVAVDVSGSIGDGDLATFFGELDAIKSSLPTRVTLFACDDQLADGAPWTFESWEPLHLPADVRGGGGTSFRPVFDWLDHHARRPDALLWFTDGMGEYPPAPPDYPVLWLLKGPSPVPWGQRIALND